MIRFEEAAEEVRKNGTKEFTLSGFLSLFDQKRRGRRVSAQIRRMLKREGLETNPSFEEVRMDGTILLQQKGIASAAPVTMKAMRGTLAPTDGQDAVDFKEAAEQIRRGGPKRITVRQLLAVFGQHRRRRARDLSKSAERPYAVHARRMLARTAATVD